MRHLILKTRMHAVIVLLVFIIPFAAFMVYYNVDIENILTEKLIQVNSERLLFHQKSVEDELETIEYFMANLVANDLSISGLRYDLSTLDAHLFTYSIMQKYQDILSANPNVTGLFIYTCNNNLYRARFSAATNMEQREQLVDYLRAKVLQDWEPSTLGWQVQEIAGKQYLLRAFNIEKTYSICVVDLEQVKDVISTTLKTQQSIILYSTLGGEPLTQRSYIREHGIAIEPGYQGIVGDFLIVQSVSDYLGISFICLIPSQGTFSKVDPLQSSLLIATSIFIILLLLCFYLLNRFYFNPMCVLGNAIAKVRAGNLETKIDANIRVSEFREVALAFNDMTDQIKRLKIKAYEQRLAVQQAELQFLQIQIRPHFFLNCLSALYGLAEVGDLAKVQQMILLLSKKLNTVFIQSNQLITLADEVEHTENYIQIQQMSQSIPILLNLDISDAAKALTIPSLSVLTFVENAVKHGVSYGKPLHILVKAEVIASAEGKMLHMYVHDNGRGFSEEDLAWFRAGEFPPDHQEHIGIANVLKRFDLIYGAQATVYFFNASGAYVDIYLPITEGITDE